MSLLRRRPIQSFLVGLAAFLCLCGVADFALWEWDQINYLYNIYAGGRSGILLGRVGYVGFFHSQWWLATKLGVTDFHGVFRPWIMIVNCALTGACVAVLYWMAHLLTGRVLAALLVAVLFLINRAVLDTALTYHGDMLMLASILLSYAFFIQAHRENKFTRLLWSAAFFGYAVGVREAAVLYFAFFPLWIYLRVPGITRPRADYGRAFLLAAVIAAAPSVYYLLVSPASYLEGIRLGTANATRFPLGGFFSNLRVMLQTHFAWPRGLAIPLLAGAAIFHIQSRRFGLTRRQAAAIAAVTAAPCLLTLAMTIAEVAKWGRYFIMGSVLWAVYLGTLIDFIAACAARWKPRLYGVVAAMGAVAVLLAHDGDFPALRRQARARAAGEETAFTKIEPYIRPDVVWLLGWHSAYVQYRLRTADLPCDIILPGWLWPADGLRQVMQSYVSAGRTIVYDPAGPWEEREPADLARALPFFKLQPQSNGLVLIQ